MFFFVKFLPTHPINHEHHVKVPHRICYKYSHHTKKTHTNDLQLGAKHESTGKATSEKQQRPDTSQLRAFLHVGACRKKQTVNVMLIRYISSQHAFKFKNEKKTATYRNGTSHRHTRASFKTKSCYRNAIIYCDGYHVQRISPLQWRARRKCPTHSWAPILGLDGSW